MKNLYSIIFCAFALVGFLHAQETTAVGDSSSVKTSQEKKTATTEKAKNAIKPRTTVGRAIEELNYLTDARPNPKAKNFIFLFSASWCTYCPPVMKQVVADYPKMKKKHVEVILFSPDSEEEIRKYVKQYGAEFPALKHSSAVTSKIPGSPRLENLPGAMIVNGKGDVLVNGHGSLAQNWESIINKKPDKKKAKRGNKDKKGAAKN